MESWKVFVVLFKVFLGISASTHWVVTENGRIQSQLDSAFHLRQPFDLLTMLEQEGRLERIESLYIEMLRRKTIIEAEWAGLESTSMLKDRVYKSDLDCRSTDLRLSEGDLYVSIVDDGSEREGINVDELLPKENDIPEGTPDTPECSEYAQMNFSMHMFPHIQVLSQPWNFSNIVDVSIDTLTESTGKQLVAGLRQNNTSWYLYNLATLYWQAQGDIQKAVQCVKLAMHYAPRRYRDIPLLNVGCLLQRAHLRAEAAILLHAAVDHAPHQPLSHYALATVYAGLADYNRSVACYDNALRLRPDWSNVERIRSSVLCHHKLESALHSLQRSLQDILTQLREYYDLHKQWLQQQEELALHQAPLQVKFHTFHQSLSSLLAHRGRKCLPLLQDSGTVLTCDSRTDIGHLSNNLVIDINLSLQLLLKTVESQAQMINEQIPKQLKETGFGLLKVLPQTSTELLDDEEGNLEIFIENTFDNQQEEPAELVEDHTSDDSSPLDQEIIEINTKLSESFKDGINQDYMGILDDYNKITHLIEGECRVTYQSTDDACPRVELKDKNQVFASLGLGDDGSWLDSTTPHLSTSLVAAWLHLGQFTNNTPPKPGGVPECGLVMAVPQLTVKLLLRTAGGSLTPEPRLKTLLSRLLNDRILSLPDIAAHLAWALQEMPSWTIATVAALYWRLLGNAQQTVACLQLAVSTAPPDSKDSPLHNTALLLFRLGHEKEALLLGSLALQVAPHSFLAHLSLYTFYSALGNKEKAVIFGRASIALQSLNDVLVL